MKILILKDIITNEYYKCKVENSSTKIGGFILHQKKNGEYRSCELVKIKEVKKVNRPYFETKVVKVKKRKDKDKYIEHYFLCPICGEQLHHSWRIDIKEPLNPWYQCDRCNNILIEGKKKKQPKGNWVNGENLNAIKFPVPCSYVEDGEKRFGLLMTRCGYYYIADLKQKEVQHEIGGGCHSLKEFILKNDIHILKGKIIIFEK